MFTVVVVVFFCVVEQKTNSQRIERKEYLDVSTRVSYVYACTRVHVFAHVYTYVRMCVHTVLHITVMFYSFARLVTTVETP